MKKIISISLALIILCTNVGLSINTHFCGGHAVDTTLSIGEHSTSCGMEEMEKDCSSQSSDNLRIDSEPCCENQLSIIQLDEDAAIQSHVKNIAPTVLSAVFIHTFIKVFSFSKKNEFHNLFYPPPLSDKDIHILYQVFII